MTQTQFTIIEDSSPYYIRFKFDNLDDIVARLQDLLNKLNYENKDFVHFKLKNEVGERILNNLPFQSVDLNPERVSFFITKPGHYYRAHKDGLDHRFSINLTIEILDSACVTSWYSDEDLKDYSTDYLMGLSRECIGFDKQKHIPLKSMTAVQGECILFNTEIYHDFDNSKSLNRRTVLTLRHKNPGQWYFDDIKKILFKL
jgi:hypothetical protein